MAGTALGRSSASRIDGRPVARSSPAVPVKGMEGIRASVPGAVSRIAILTSGAGGWTRGPTNLELTLSMTQAGSAAPGMGAALDSSGPVNQIVVGSEREAVERRRGVFGMGGWHSGL